MINKSYDKIGKAINEIMIQTAFECAYIVFQEIVNILEKTEKENTDETEKKEEKNDN